MRANEGCPVVLVVDDDEDYLMMLEASFDAAGFVVQTALSFAQARTKLFEHHIDALVADLTLGDGSALDLLHPLGDDRPTVAVVLSGFDRPEDFDRTLAAGFDAHLVKPMPFDRLVHIISDGLYSRESGVLRARPCTEMPLSGAWNTEPGVSAQAAV
ncbi:MAG: response regulator [Polyangiaceae bacterium]|nr:response regulator [Polyangiaceae bacterium]